MCKRLNALLVPLNLTPGYLASRGRTFSQENFLLRHIIDRKQKV